MWVCQGRIVEHSPKSARNEHTPRYTSYYVEDRVGQDSAIVHMWALKKLRRASPVILATMPIVLCPSARSSTFSGFRSPARTCKHACKLKHASMQAP